MERDPTHASRAVERGGPEDSPVASPGPDPAARQARRPSGSPLGFGLGPLLVRLEGPRERLTDRETETITGRVSGGTPARLTLYQNGSGKELGLDRESFQVALALQPGVNHLRAVAVDGRGVESEDTLMVEYTPPPQRHGVTITSPEDGYRVPADAPPLVTVEGEVEDRDAATIWLVANERRLAVRVRQGRFRQVLPLFEPELRVWAETAPNGSPAHRSPTVVVRGSAPIPAMSLVSMDWAQADGVQAEMSVVWRGSPGRVDVPGQAMPLQAVGAPGNGVPSEVYYLRHLKPGVYAFVLRYRAPAAAGSARPTLYVADGGTVRARALRPVLLSGAGKVVIARILLPEGILWEQDDWFTGRSESTETVTKFRLPEGITWTERKADLR